MERYQTLKCPYCEAEYLPGEIFLPRYFLGEPKDVERDYAGKLLYYDGLEQDLKESYTCDYCKETFDVTAKINYRVEEKTRYRNKNTYTYKQ